MADADDTGICDRVGNPDVQLPHGASYLRVLHPRRRRWRPAPWGGVTSVMFKTPCFFSPSMLAQAVAEGHIATNSRCGRKDSSAVPESSCDARKPE